MKQYNYSVLVLCITLSLSGCGGSGETSNVTPNVNTSNLPVPGNHLSKNSPEGIWLADYQLIESIKTEQFSRKSNEQGRQILIIHPEEDGRYSITECEHLSFIRGPIYYSTSSEGSVLKNEEDRFVTRDITFENYVTAIVSGENELIGETTTINQQFEMAAVKLSDETSFSYATSELAINLTAQGENSITESSHLGGLLCASSSQISMELQNSEGIFSFSTNASVIEGSNYSFRFNDYAGEHPENDVSLMAFNIPNVEWIIAGCDDCIQLKYISSETTKQTESEFSFYAHARTEEDEDYSIEFEMLLLSDIPPTE